MGDPGYSAEEQRTWLKDANKSIKRNAFYLRKAMDDDNLREALRYSAAMLGELRTSMLDPQKYYELYMQASDELQQVQLFFADEHTKGRSYADLYELVQHAGNVLPRLYLLCTVGAAYIKSREAPAKDVLKDLVELCKGVQHPTRGLFLRAYLCQVSRGLLPDTGSLYEGGEGGSVLDALEFLLVNFTEMNKLWVRMQHQGSTRNREQREKERQQLADLVGKNLTYLSQLDGLDLGLYKEIVLPRVLEQVVQCKDPLAQQYLMQCLIMGFPDEFHLATLDLLLGTLPQLQPGVKVHAVMGSLMERLASHATSNTSVIAEMSSVDAFGRMSASALKVVEQHPDMAAADVAAMYGAMLAFAGAVYPDNLGYVDRVLQTCYDALQSRGPISDSKAEKQVVGLLSTPLERYDVVTVLRLAHYHSVLRLLRPAMRREMAVKIVQTMLKTGSRVVSVDQVEMLFSFIGPLVQDMEGGEEELDDEDLAEEQSLVARLVHNLSQGDPDTQFEVLKAAQAHFLRGGPRRMRHTLPPLCLCALQSVRSATSMAAAAPSTPQPPQETQHAASEDGPEEGPSAAQPAVQHAQREPGQEAQQAQHGAPSVPPERWYQFLHSTITALANAPAPEAALQLFLMSAHSASEEAGLELTAYEFLEQAFVLYEESIPDSKQEIRALQSIMGTLHKCHVFSSDNRDALVHKAGSYCSKLLKRTDQCLAVLSWSHLYWQQPAEQGSPGVRDAQGVLSCLKRALKIANAAQQQLAVAAKPGGEAGPALLFVEILSHYLYYFQEGCQLITTAVLQSLLELVSSEVSRETLKDNAELQAFYRNTLAHIAAQREKGGELGGKYAELRP